MTHSSLHELIERCRELQSQNPQVVDTQMSLLTAEEIHATVRKSATKGGKMNPKMLPPIVNGDPGDETDFIERVSWDD